MRIFICSNRKFLGNVGGGGGVNYRLASINAKTNDEIEIINVFSDCCITKESFEQTPICVNKKGKVKTRIRRFFFNHPFLLPTVYINRIKKAAAYLEKANSEFGFRQDDVFFLHDLESAIAFGKKFNMKASVLVYHHQGSIYYEWASDYSKKSQRLQAWMDQYLKSAFSSVTYWGFPSAGARESLIETAPQLKDFLSSHDYSVFYNGLDCIIKSQSENAKVKSLMDELDRFEGMKFLTVSTLNEAKGVDNIPLFLKKLKENNKIFKWILIGQGVKEKEIESKISEYGLKENVIWIDERVDHDDILRLLEKGDFYLMFHRFSIFDFATVEAMGCGCIPVLTPVGGNKEVILDNNGVFISDTSSCAEFINYINEIDIDEKKSQNKQLQKSHFSEEQFLKQYISFAKKIGDVDCEH